MKYRVVKFTVIKDDAVDSDYTACGCPVANSLKRHGVDVVGFGGIVPKKDVIPTEIMLSEDGYDFIDRYDATLHQDYQAVFAIRRRLPQSFTAFVPMGV